MMRRANRPWLKAYSPPVTYLCVQVRGVVVMNTTSIQNTEEGASEDEQLGKQQDSWYQDKDGPDAFWE